MSVFDSFWETFTRFGLEPFGKYYSVYRAKCSSNEDPQKQGRIKIIVEAFGTDKELPEFAYPITPFASKDAGMFFPPENGDQIYVMFENGNPRLPMYLGGWWMKGDLPDSFKNTPPTVRGIETKSGHKILFDDSLLTPGIKIETAAGHRIFLSDNTADMSAKIETAGGAVITLKDTPEQSIEIAKQEGQAPLIKIDKDGKIMLYDPNSTEAFVLGTTFIRDYLNHIHIAPFGPTSAPIPNGLYTSFNVFGK